MKKTQPSKEEEATAEINKKLRDVKQRYFSDLLHLPGVVMVGLGSNYLRIYVDAEVIGAGEGSLPRSIEGIPVRIIPYDIPKEADDNSNKDRHRLQTMDDGTHE